MIGLLGKKLGMTHVYDSYGRHLAVTAIQAGPCTVTALRAPKQHGYEAIQVGFEPVAEKAITKPKAGQFKKAGTSHIAVLQIESFIAMPSFGLSLRGRSGLPRDCGPCHAARGLWVWRWLRRLSGPIARLHAPPGCPRPTPGGNSLNAMPPCRAPRGGRAPRSAAILRPAFSCPGHNRPDSRCGTCGLPPASRRCP